MGCSTEGSAADGGEENAREDPVMVASNIIAKPVRGVGGFYAMALDTLVAIPAAVRVARVPLAVLGLSRGSRWCRR